MEPRFPAFNLETVLLYLGDLLNSIYQMDLLLTETGFHLRIHVYDTGIFNLPTASASFVILLVVVELVNEPAATLTGYAGSSPRNEAG